MPRTWPSMRRRLRRRSSLFIAYPAIQIPYPRRVTSARRRRPSATSRRSRVEAMPSDVVLKLMNALHRGVLKASGGRLGWEGSGMPVLELTTTGRKSGQPRSVMLTSPFQEGSTIVVVASRGGDDHHPAWFLNLRDDPNVEVKTKGEPKRRMVARI